MDRIRLIASDMDATLLDGHSQLPPDFLHLVQELAGQDILFAAASGRPLYKLEEMFAPVLEQTILVADNGGAVRWRGKDLFVSRMEPEVWHRLTACAEENGDSFVVCGLENAYLRPCDRCYDAVYRNFYNRIAYVSDLYTIDAAVDKFTIYLPQDNAQEVYEKVYGPRFGQELAVAVSGKCWIDVTNPGVTKGKAVERLSRQKLGGRDEPLCAQGCSTGKGGCTAGHSGRQHDGLWRHLQRHRDAGGRGLRLPDGKRKPGAAQPGAVSGPAQHGIRGGPGAAAGIAAKGLRLPGGFYKSTLTP